MLPLFLGVLESRLDRRWGWMRWSEETVLQIGNATLFSGFSLLAVIELDLVVTVAYTAAAACH